MWNIDFFLFSMSNVVQHMVECNTGIQFYHPFQNGTYRLLRKHGSLTRARNRWINSRWGWREHSRRILEMVPWRRRSTTHTGVHARHRSSRRRHGGKRGVCGGPQWRRRSARWRMYVRRVYRHTRSVAWVHILCREVLETLLVHGREQVRLRLRKVSIFVSRGQGSSCRNICGGAYHKIRWHVCW